jgi:hypothetical protein
MSTQLSRGIETIVAPVRVASTRASMSTSLRSRPRPSPSAPVPVVGASLRVSVPTNRNVSAPVNGGRAASSSGAKDVGHPVDLVADLLRHEELDEGRSTQQAGEQEGGEGQGTTAGSPPPRWRSPVFRGINGREQTRPPRVSV